MPDLINFLDNFSGVHIMKLYARFPGGQMLDDRWAAGTVHHLRTPPAT
jgi:hypothetical protein